MIKRNWVFCLIVLLFLLTRIYKIQDIPGSLYWDEASISYNAYSIVRTGHDEWGKFFPVHFRAFGEFKLPVYIYAVSILEIFLGNEVLAVRLPAVIFSLLSLIFVYLLTREIFKNKMISNMAALFFTTSPWLFIFSRTGYEATAGLSFYLAGIYFFISQGKWRKLIAMICFLATFYSYNSFVILTPLTIVLLILFKTRDAINPFIQKIELFSILIITVIVLIPTLHFYISEGRTRYDQVRIKNVQEIPQNYLKHLEPNFLLRGDKNPRSQIPGTGQIYFIDMCLVIAGLMFLISEKKKAYLLIPALMFLGPLPAVITKESPHALRSITMVPFLAILSSVGVQFLYEAIKKKLVIYMAIGVMLLFFGDYLYLFNKDYNVLSSKDWQYGYKQVFTNYREDFTKYDHVIISDKEGQPYIFALYYLSVDPDQYLKTVVYNSVDKWGFSKVKSFGNFIFETVNYATLPKGKLLVFATPQDTITKPIKDIIRYPNSSIAFYIYEIDNR